VRSSARTSRIWRALGPVSWSTADQALSALSNIVITLAVTRGAGLNGLGQFSLALAAYITVLGFQRSLISEPLLTVRRQETDRQGERAALTLTLLCSILGALVVAAVGLVLGRTEFLVVAAALPVLLLHDLLRYQAFRRKRAQLAVLLDGGWLIGSLLAWPMISTAESVVSALWCWSGAALLGVLVGGWVLRPGLVSPRAALDWWNAECRVIALPLVLDSVLVTASLQALVFLVVATGGDSQLGLLRAAQVYFNPLGMVFTAIGVTAVPHLVQRSRPMSTALGFRLSGLLVAMACLVCAVVVVAEPLLNTVLFDGAVDTPTWLLIPLVAQVVVSAGAGGLFVANKVRRRGGDLGRSRVTSTLFGMVVLVPATLAWGLEGAVWALVLQGVIYLLDMSVRTIRHSHDGNDIARQPYAAAASEGRPC
jgi:O-antigen/teichoic acid export membrane protein